MTRIEAIANLYRTVLGRDPDQPGLEHYAHNGAPLEEVERLLRSSDEYRRSSARTAADSILREYDELHPKVPVRKIHQIYISDNNVPPGKHVADKMQRLRALYDDYQYTLYDGDMCRNEVRNLLGERGVKAYESLVAYAFKADLARYCILYQHGGLYFDSVICPERKLEVSDRPMMYLAPRSYWEGHGRIIENGVMLFPDTRHPFIRDAIINCLVNIELRSYTSMLGITGPHMLGSLYTYDIQLGQSAYLSPEQQAEYGTQKGAFFEDELHWLYKPVGTTITHTYGGKGTNSYEDLWIKGRIFKRPDDVNIKFISFYTSDYQQDADKLKESLAELDIDCSGIEYRETTGSWESNTQMKAEFILEQLRKCDAVVWTDADSVVRRYPDLFDSITTDVGLFFLPQELSQGFIPPPHSILKDADRYLQSGTMYFRNTDRVIKLLEAWIELNKKDSRQWDQWTLQTVLEDSDVTITELPPEYVWAPFVAAVYPNKKPVIEHSLASSRNENIVR